MGESINNGAAANEPIPVNQYMSIKVLKDSLNNTFDVVAIL